MTKYAARPVSYQLPPWVGNDAASGAAGEPSQSARNHREDPSWAPETLLGGMPDGAATIRYGTPREASGLTRATVYAFGEAATNNWFLWSISVLALIFATYSLVLGFDNKDQAKFFTERATQFDSVTSRLAALAERVEAAGATLSHLQLAAQQDRDDVKRSQAALQGNIARITERLNHFIEETRDRDAASELRLTRLEANETVAVNQPVAPKPNVRVSDPERVRTRPSELNNSEPRSDPAPKVILKTDAVSAAAIAEMEGLAPVPVDNVAGSKAPKSETHHHKRKRSGPSKKSVAAPTPAP